MKTNGYQVKQKAMHKSICEKSNCNILSAVSRERIRLHIKLNPKSVQTSVVDSARPRQKRFLNGTRLTLGQSLIGARRLSNQLSALCVRTIDGPPTTT